MSRSAGEHYFIELKPSAPRGAGKRGELPHEEIALYILSPRPVRRIGGRTEFDQHIAEFDKYNTVGEQHTDDTGSEQPKQQPVHDRAAGKHDPQLNHGCFSAIEFAEQQPVNDCPKQLNHAEQH